MRHMWVTEVTVSPQCPDGASKIKIDVFDNNVPLEYPYKLPKN